MTCFYYICPDTASPKNLWLHLLCSLLLIYKIRNGISPPPSPSRGWTNPGLSSMSCAKFPDQFSDLHHTHSNMSICFMFWGDKNWTKHADVISWIQGKDHFPWLLLPTVLTQCRMQLAIFAERVCCCFMPNPAVHHELQFPPLFLILGVK